MDVEEKSSSAVSVIPCGAGPGGPGGNPCPGWPRGAPPGCDIGG